MIVTTGAPVADDSVAHVPDALVMLMADHAAVERLFDRLGDASSHDERAMLAGHLCRLLEVHASCEEELLYPAASVVLSDDRLVQAAKVDHLAARELMRRVEVLSPAEPQFGPTVRVLQDYVLHHAGEEERALFPRLRRSRLDLQSLGVALAARRDELERLSGEPPRPGRDSARKAGTHGAVFTRETPWAPARHPASGETPHRTGGHAS